MSKISEAKKQLRLNEWIEMYRRYQESGKTILEWCQEENLSSKTFYYRLRKVRENLLESQERHEIVPVQTNGIEAVSVSKAAPSQPIVIRAGGIVAELPANISPETLSAVIKGLR